MQLASLDLSKAFDKLQPKIVIRKMQDYGVNRHALSIIEDFLKRREQCVKVNGSFSEYINISVGAPQGTRLGPQLWIFYVNDLSADGFHAIKYADDTSFYKAIKTPEETVVPAILATQKWADDNFMSLNTGKTQVMNIFINSRY